MKRIVLFGLLALVACSKKQEAPAPAPVQTTAAAPVSDDWAGKYEGDLRVTIDAAHKVTLIEAAPDGCTGDIGLADGGLMTNSVGDNELHLIMHPDAVTTCTVTLHKSGETIAISESEGCNAYHGATCTFSGTATRIK